MIGEYDIIVLSWGELDVRLIIVVYDSFEVKLEDERVYDWVIFV